MDPLEKWPEVEAILKGNTGTYKNSLGCHDTFLSIRDAIQRHDLFKPSKFRPFPLGKTQIDNSAYHPRKTIEDQFIASYTLSPPKTFIIVVAPEGLGKTTLLQYVFGYELPHSNNRNIEIGSFILLETRNWVAASSSTDFSNYIYAEVATHLRSPEFKWARDAYDEFRIAATSTQSDLTKWASMTPAQFATDILAFVSVFAHDVSKRTDTNFIATIIFDNMDQMPLRQQIDLFRAIYSFHFQIERQGAGFREILRLLAWDFHHDDKICTILPMRPNTYKTLSDGIGSFIHPRPETMIADNLLQNSDLSIWEIITSRLSTNMAFNSQQVAALRVSVLHHKAGQITVSVDDVRDYFISLIAWVKRIGSSAEDRIKLFCNSSLRRELLFGLKIIGHPGLRYLYDQIRLEIKPIRAFSAQVES